MNSRHVYTEVEKAFIEAAHDLYTVKEVAAKLGLPEASVYQMARRMDPPVQFKPHRGSLELTRGRVTVVFAEEELDYYQAILNRLGEVTGVTSKSGAFLKALELANLWLDFTEEDIEDDMERTDTQGGSAPRGVPVGRDGGEHQGTPVR